MQLSVIFTLLVELADALGVKKINELGGAWVCKIDPHWTIALNGTKQKTEVTIEGAMGATLEPYQMAVFFNGWLAGLMYPNGGVICAGEAGNEDNLIAALRARIEQETGARPRRPNTEVSHGA